MHEKCGYFMDNSIIFKKINKSKNIKERKNPGGRLGSTSYYQQSLSSPIWVELGRLDGLC